MHTATTRRRVGPAGRTAALWALGGLAGLALCLAALSGLRRLEAQGTDLRDEHLPALAAASDTARAAASGQEAFLEAAETSDPIRRTAAITSAESSGRTQEAAWTTYLERAADRPGEAALQDAYEQASRRSRELAATLVTMAPDDPERPAVLAEERREAARLQAALVALVDEVYRPLVDERAARIVDDTRGARVAVGLTGAAAATLFSAAAYLLLRGTRRDQRRFDREARELRLASEQADLEGSLQRGLEMAPGEDATFGIIEQALTIVAPAVSAELLLADSSRAHFRQVLATDASPASACRVGGPSDCPAASSGQTWVFEDSTQLDACRYLREQPDTVWATCVPVSIGGRATAVVHVQAPIATPRPEGLTTGLELVARKAGERIGTLRVRARTEAEAQLDPLTGLPNRRTLENEVHDLRIQDAAYVVAFADLDHFKAINDAHGHEVGDRSLRLFARVLRDSIRPRDLPCRYGGEEFVAVLPDCSAEDARVVAERIRRGLMEALAHATVPPFTVTVGLAAARPGDRLADVVGRADTAMLQGKAAGRDRVLVADDAGRRGHVALRSLDAG